MRLTQRTVKAEKPGPARRYLWDEDEPGFGLVLQPTGARTFVYKYRTARGTRRQVNLGKWPGTTAEAARAKAQRFSAMVANGGDPLTEREAAKRPAADAVTWAAWVAHYLEGARSRKKRPYDDVMYLMGTEGRKHSGRKGKSNPSEAMRRWGALPLAEITPRDVEALARWADKGGTHPTKANRLLASVRACLEAAVTEGVIRENPARRVKKFPEAPPRQMTMTPDELAAVRRAVAALESLSDRALLTVLVETGARASEACSMVWESLDLAGGGWTLKSPKAGRVQVQPLPRVVVEALDRVPKVGPYLFPHPHDPQRPRREVRGLWSRVRAAAGVRPEVHLHDIRRSFGSRVAREAGILAASRLLRHSSTAITSKVYAVVAGEDLKAFAEAAAGATVVPIGKGRRRATA